MKKVCCYLFIKKIFLTFYLFLRQGETQHEQGRVRERGRHRIWNRLQALSCQHRARCGARTHGPRDHDLSRSQTPNWLSHPGAPEDLLFLCEEWSKNNQEFHPCRYVISTSFPLVAKEYLITHINHTLWIRSSVNGDWQGTKSPWRVTKVVLI